MADYINIGKFVASFGLKGDVVLKHHLGKKTSLKGLKALFVEDKKNSFLPWFIQSAKIKNEEELYVKLEGIDQKEQTKLVLQKEAWLPQEEFKKYSAASSPVNFLGYTIISEGNRLGEILEVIEQPHQLLCSITINGKEVYIPLHQETMVKVDRKKKEITVSLPPGLLEIYL